MNSTSNAGFGPVLAVRSLLSDLTVPYWIVGGWAIDLAAGRVTREHADVDVMLLERDEHALRTDLTGVNVRFVGRGGQPGPWPAGRRHRDGIPFLAPEVVLLLKARSKAERDQRDVQTALPVLSAEQRSWLRDTLEHLPRGQTAPVSRR
jgi:hypothetical protein